MRALSAIVLAAILVVLTGCGPAADALPVRTVTVGGESWTVYEAGPDGMRGVPGFGDADGMLFDMGTEVHPSGAAFVMDGVGIPIDIAWFDASGALVGVASMEPCEAAPCLLYRPTAPYRWAIEGPVGAFERLEPNDRLVVEG